MTSELEAQCPLFSPEWFARARALAAEVAISSGSARLQFDVAGTRWFLEVVDGRITGWDLGSLEEPDVEVRWQPEVARRIIARELRGDAAYAETTVAARDADGMYVGPPAPACLVGRPELDAMRAIPGATFGVQFVYPRGPFGEVQHVLRFEDGRLAEERLGELDRPDVVVVVTYRAMARTRAGEISIIEALEDGSLKGELGPLGALAGILETPEFHAAELATGRHAIALAVLGELDSDPQFVAAMEQLAAITERS